MTPRIDVLRRVSIAAIGSILCAATAAHAQSRAGDPRWEAWSGCWQSVGATEAPTRAVVCVTPISGQAIEVATVDRGKVIGRDTIDASGEKHALAAQGCSGWRRADWSRDVRRVYLYSEVSCGSTVTRSSSGMIAMTSGGDWIDIQAASANGNSGVRTTRYQEVGPWFADLPPEFANVIEARTRLPYAARALAGSGVNTKDVIEATTRVDSLVVEAWLAERHQKFNLDGHTLVELEKAGVPGSITDIMIGVSFPDRFAIQQPSGVDAGAAQATTGPVMNSARSTAQRCSVVDPYWYPQRGDDPCGARYSYRGGAGYYGYDPYGYDPYGYYSPYRYGSYGYSPYGYYGSGYSTPVIVVKDPRKPEPPHGRIVNGQGYTRNSGNDGDADAPRGQSSASRGSSTGSSSSGSSRSGSSSSSSGKSSSSSSSSSSSGRTAQSRKQ